MTVHFIGAGPGDPELITIRGRRLIESCSVCLFAGSLVPKEVISYAPEGAIIIDTATLNLEEIIQIIADHNATGKDISRVHSGDPSLYGAISEQIRRLKELNIDFEITPGISRLCCSSSSKALGQELTLPGISQTVILTRTTMKSSKMPPGEELSKLANSGATLAIHLSIRNLRFIRREIEPQYGSRCPVVIIYRASWPDQK